MFSNSHNILLGAVILPGSWRRKKSVTKLTHCAMKKNTHTHTIERIVDCNRIIEYFADILHLYQDVQEKELCKRSFLLICASGVVYESSFTILLHKSMAFFCALKRHIVVCFCCYIAML